jgi:hypothetical protein
MKTRYLILLLTVLMTGIYACKEEERFGINSDDSTPPGKPILLDTKQLNGGARLFYKVPNDKDVLSIDAEYTTATGKTAKFSASYFKDSLDIYGMADTVPHTVQLYAVDRAGNKSEPVSVSVTPLESVISLVAKSVIAKSGFSSFFVDWTNELEQNVNVYVDFNFTQNGVNREYTIVFSSKALSDRRFVNDLELTAQEPVSVKIRVEDRYGNMTSPLDLGSLVMLRDEVIPKDKWYFPAPNDSIDGEPQCWALQDGARLSCIMDGIIDDLGQAVYYTHTGGNKGRTGNPANGNVPWNLFIDMGDYYELSRILTHQRRNNANVTNKGFYYGNENVGRFNLYYLDEETGKWEYCSQNTIPIPTDLSDLEIIKMALAGDMAYFYPDDPKFTKPARWFRYEALACFLNNYTSTNANSLCELTLYGRKANR